MTVESLEPRFTMREAVAWREFERGFGPITLHERIDAVGALIAHTVAKGSGLKRENGGELEVRDFMPTWGPEVVGEVSDLFHAMARGG
jgi:hypothetical protein